MLRNLQQANEIVSKLLWKVDFYFEIYIAQKPWQKKQTWPPEAAEMYHLMGMCYTEMRDYSSAHDAFNNAIRIDLKFAEVIHYPLCCWDSIYFINKLELTLVPLNCLFLFFNYLKLELLTQFPASNDDFCGIYFDLKHMPEKIFSPSSTTWVNKTVCGGWYLTQTILINFFY